MSTAHVDGACHCGSTHTFVEREDTLVPPRPGGDGHREWGDGVYINPRDHIVGSVDFSSIPVSLVCWCGARVEAPTPAALEVAWDAHRGVDGSANRAVEGKWRYDRATDDEVHDFFAALENPAYIPDSITAYGGYGDH